jgi:uncharacterized protein (TIGR02147 family)
MLLNPLNYSDYKVFLRAYIADSKGSRGASSAMADAAGCNRSYFSQVLNSHVHLTPEQALPLAQFMNLPPARERYFCLLVDHARAGTKKLRERIEKDLAAIRTEEETLDLRFKTKKLEPGERELFYYSSWIYAAAHVLTSVPAFQTEEALAQRIGLPLHQVQYVLAELEKYQLVQRKGPRWVLREGDLHVGRGSLLNSVNHSNWRNQAVLDSQKPGTESVHYTSVASMSLEDFKRLKAMVLQFIDESRVIVAASPEEDVVCTTIDFFRL